MSRDGIKKYVCYLLGTRANIHLYTICEYFKILWIFTNI